MKGVSLEADAATLDAQEIHAQANPIPPNHIPRPGLPEHIRQARQQFDGFAIKRPDPTVQRDLRHGWLLPLLLRLDEWLWQRWDYWFQCCQNGRLPDVPIPRIEFLMAPHAGTRKMLEASLNCIPNHGSWQTWGNWLYVNYFFDRLLFACGHPGTPEAPPEPAGCSGASNRLFQVFKLDAMLLWPYEYFGDILSEVSYGRGQGFYATPHTVCEMMVRMLFDEGQDHRCETMLDPCVGTGRFPLFASNYSLRLYGMDIDPTLCKATLVNGYLYAPWLVRPIPWLDPGLAQIAQQEAVGATDEAGRASASSTPSSKGLGPPGTNQPEHRPDAKPRAAATAALHLAAQLSDRMVEAAPPHAQGYLAATEHDAAAQFQLAPILKRRKKSRSASPDQGSLF